MEPGSGFGQTLGITFGDTWGARLEDLDPYLLLLSPSNMTEHFTKIQLTPGSLVVRGSSCPLVGHVVTISPSERQSSLNVTHLTDTSCPHTARATYSPCPIDKVRRGGGIGCAGE